MVKIPQKFRQKIFDYVSMQMTDVHLNAESFDLYNIEGKVDSICLKIDEILAPME